MHPLSVVDALQLAVAIIAADHEPSSLAFEHSRVSGELAANDRIGISGLDFKRSRDCEAQKA